MLVGKLRESIGSASARRLRRDGYLTANIYAKGVDNIQVSFLGKGWIFHQNCKGGKGEPLHSKVKG